VLLCGTDWNCCPLNTCCSLNCCPLSTCCSLNCCPLNTCCSLNCCPLNTCCSLNFCPLNTCCSLELLSAEHLLFTCHTRPHLALASFTKSESVSVQQTLTLEVIVQYKCRLSVKYFISVYSIILEQWLSKLSPLLPKCLRGIWEGKCVIKCVFLF